MEYIGNIKVSPKLPESLKRLNELAYNFYFTWNPEVRDLFIDIDRQLWKEVNHNPVKFLRVVQQNKLVEKSGDQQFLKRYQAVLADFDRYMTEKNTWFHQNYPDFRDRVIAYFTAEFGFHESLPIYAGGLGVLAGDHLKSASDLGIPLVGVTLFYDQTYFTQEIDAEGNQKAVYHALNPLELPLQPVTHQDGTPLLIQVPVASRMVKIRIWEARVGRLSAYLLDTNIPENVPADRKITSRLYGGNQEMRISQEIVLGMGGAIALKEMGYNPSAWHMNEGHSVFLALQRIQNLVQEHQLKFYEALEAVASNTIFTTHTPVPAGNDAFPLHIKEKYFQKYWESVGIKRHQFMELGSQVQPEGYEIFNLTILALNLSRHRNAVSRLHGEVSRKLWKTVWPNIPSQEVPIDYITNGVHTATWTARKTRSLFQQHVAGDWLGNQDNPEFWEQVDSIPDDILWETKLALKEKMLNHVKERLEKQYLRNNIGALRTLRIKQTLKKETLTIGFARRFATYKRGTLLFRDLERFKRIVNNADRPVQIIFAGKAHPKDEGGQKLIREINELAMKPEFRGKVIFVENYDMGLARDLVSGVDVWLNNPRRTQEASGTSGQKAGMNGGLNFSVLDGWWCEGFNGKNGWAFGDRDDFESLEEWDAWDSEELYDILENDIIPLYYDQKDGIPHRWISYMKNAIKSIMPVFNTHRMLKEYLNKMYFTAIDLGEKYRENNFKIAREISAWKERIDQNWYEVKIIGHRAGDQSGNTILLNFGDVYQTDVEVDLGKLSPDDVKVQMYLKKTGFNNHEPVGYEIFDLEKEQQLENGHYLYRARIQPSDSGNYEFTFRVIPYHPYLAHSVEMGLAAWFQNLQG